MVFIYIFSLFTLITIEKIILSLKVEKINRKNKKQIRIFLLTNQNIFNIKPCGKFNSMLAKLFNSVKIKRKISLKII